MVVDLVEIDVGFAGASRGGQGSTGLLGQVMSSRPLVPLCPEGPGEHEAGFGE
ncbi:MAG: hypothetical protein AAGF11_55640 [Myxococcota bacterium]